MVEGKGQTRNWLIIALAIVEGFIQTPLVLLGVNPWTGSQVKRGVILKESSEMVPEQTTGFLKYGYSNTFPQIFVLAMGMSSIKSVFMPCLWALL